MYRNVADAKKIKSRIVKFHDLKSVSELTVDTNLTDEGQFLIEVTSPDSRIRILHSWDESKWSYTNPGSINLKFTDIETGKSCIAIMIEWPLEDFPRLIEKAYRLSEMFLKGEYEIQKSKWLFIFSKEYIFFKDEKLIYKYLTKI